jgi:hypothetical protein
VIVGAPEDESEQLRLGIEKAGAVYRCQTVMPYRCHQIPFDTSGKNLIPLLSIHFTCQLYRGPISSTCLRTAFTCANALALNLRFTNKTTPNFASTLSYI